MRGLFRDGAALFEASAAQLRTWLSETPLADPVGQQALADCLLAEGTCAVFWAQNDLAQRLLDEAREIYLQYDAQREPASVYVSLGQVAFNRGQFHIARSYFQQAYDLATATGYVVCERDASHYLGQINHVLGDYACARDYLDRSLALSEVLGDGWLALHTIRLRGNVENSLGQMESARDFYRRSLKLAREFESLQGIALTLNNLAVLAVIASDYQIARRYWEQALAIQRDAGNARQIANTLHNLGVVVTDLGEPELGLQLTQEALELHRSGADQNGEGYALLYRAYAFEVLGDGMAAEPAYRVALALFEASHNLAGVADVQECLGTFLHTQGRDAEAEQLLRETLELREALGGPGGIATTLRGLGSVALACGRYAEARTHFRKALELASSANWDGALLHIFVEVAELRAQTGDVEGALEILLPVLRDRRTIHPLQQRVRKRVAALLTMLSPEGAVTLQPHEGPLEVAVLALALARAL